MMRAPNEEIESVHLVVSRDPRASEGSVLRPFLLWACHPAFFLFLLGTILAATGCRSTDYLAVRKEPWNPLEHSIEFVSSQQARPSKRTRQLLRRYDLETMYESDPAEALARLREELEREPEAEKAIAFAELAYIQGYRQDALGQDPEALNWYGSSVLAAYQYLFDPHYDPLRNPYDPQFRKACDLYNKSLESSLRILRKEGRLVVGTEQRLDNAGRQCRLRIVPRGSWKPEHLGRFEFVSDYDVRGLRNHYTTYGLGVPLIAVHADHHDTRDPIDRRYPKGLAFPATAFLRIHRTHDQTSDGVAVVDLELYDPLVSTDLIVAGRRVPLQSDITVPLGYSLDSPSLKESQRFATLGLLFPDDVESYRGIYLLEPYDPNKIPVLLVHGLWSTPLTWIDMFNDLRAFPEIRTRYQFWFYMYPTAKPFWESAAALREDLAALRAEIDPHHLQPNLDQMVLVGHSMGGLLSRMQVIDSGDRFWAAVAKGSFEELEAAPEVKQHIAQVAFFRANPSIRRVITLGTPHRGSELANDVTEWVARKVIRIPKTLLWRSQVIRKNRDLFKSSVLVQPVTSIDSLSPDNPFFPVLNAIEPPPTVHQHNVVGLVEEKSWWKWLEDEPSDGVVPFWSAHWEQAESEVVVTADHQNIHRHPRAILEVRRILLEHLQEVDHAAYPVRPASVSVPHRLAPLQSATILR